MIKFFIKQAYKNKLYIKYIISGGTATLIDFSLLYFFTDIINLYYLISASIAFLVAFIISFCMQKFWTFRDNNRKKINKQIFLYFLVGIIGLVANYFGMYILVEKYNIWYIFSQAIITSILAIGNFLVYRYIIFIKKKIKKRKEIKI